MPATLEFFYAKKTGRDGLYSICKDCIKTSSAQWTKANPEKHNANTKRWAAEHPEKVAAKNRRWAEHNHEKSAAYVRRWQKAHPEYVRAKCLARTRANPEWNVARVREWAKNNPEKCAAHHRNRRARIRNAPGVHSAADISAQYERQKGRCFYCKEKVGDKYHVDHVVPLAEGGSNGPENLVIACPRCNMQKGKRHPMDFAGMLL